MEQQEVAMSLDGTWWRSGASAQGLAASARRGLALALGMAHSISERRQRERLKELAPEFVRRERRRTHQERLHARRLIALWNLRARLRRRATFFPTLDTALAAQRPMLDVFCPGCRTVGRLDLRNVDVHPDAPISALIPRLSCRRCSPDPPFAVLGELMPGPPHWRDQPEIWRGRMK